jgi:hypothetical protein
MPSAAVAQTPSTTARNPGMCLKYICCRTVLSEDTGGYSYLPRGGSLGTHVRSWGLAKKRISRREAVPRRRDRVEGRATRADVMAEFLRRGETALRMLMPQECKRAVHA